MVFLRYVTGTTAVLIFSPENRRYLTGFSSSLGYLLLTQNGNILFVPISQQLVIKTYLVSAQRLAGRTRTNCSLP